jgi:hypothetical protein
MEALENERGEGKRRNTLQGGEPKKFIETHYEDMKVKTLFGVFLLITILINVDFGVLAASSLEVKESLELDNLGFGALQSMVFLGTIIGKIFMNLMTCLFLG